MQNTSAVQVQSSEKGENRGKSPEFSEASTYWFPVYEGLFEHAPTMRDAVWFFMWIIARTTIERDGEGRVLGGVPIDDGRPARELGVSIKVIRRWRRILLKGGYILTVRTGYGFIYTLLKSKKYQYRDRPNRPISKPNPTGNQDREVPDRADQIGRIGQFRSAGAGSSNKKIQGQYREDGRGGGAPETGATPPTATPTQSAPVLKEPWEVLGLTMPIGSVGFQGEWEAFYDQHIDEHVNLVDVMEEFIQFKQTRGQKGIPPKFYELKHELEREAKEFDRDYEEAQRWVEAQKELETSGQVILMAPLPALPERAGASPDCLNQTKREMTPERQALAERNILATVLRDNDALGKHPQIKNLEAGHFTADERHQTIFTGMRSLWREGKVISTNTLSHWLYFNRRDGQKRVSNAYLQSLASDAELLAPARKEATA